MLDLSIIILSYNTESFLKQCLTSLLQTLYQATSIKAEVIVVDNASNDNSVAMVKKDFPEVKLIESGENGGFAKGNNLGVHVAQGRYVLFLNSDAIFVENKNLHPFEKLIRFMEENPRAGAVTCRVNLANGAIDDACHRGFPTPWNAFCHFSGLGRIFPVSTFFNGYHLGYKHLGKIHEIDALAGAFMLVRREAGDMAGWWDEEYFFYGEDLDFCYMLRQKGWKIYFLPDVFVIHFKGVSSGIKDTSKHVTKATRSEKRRITHARFEAMRIFYRKHYTTVYPRAITGLIMYGISIKEQLVLRSL